MKLLASLGLILGCAASMNVLGAGIHYRIENEQAQAIFNSLTNVKSEGAAGHTYKKGKSILCWKIEADINDEEGNLIPRDDSRRYSCSVHFDNEGLATPGNRF